MCAPAKLNADQSESIYRLHLQIVELYFVRFVIWLANPRHKL